MSGAIERYAEKGWKEGITIGTERAGHSIALNLLAEGFSCEEVEILETIQRLRLMDDYFMQVCFQNSRECTELLLRIILDKPDLKVQRVTRLCVKPRPSG